MAREMILVVIYLVFLSMIKIFIVNLIIDFTDWTVVRKIRLLLIFNRNL